MNLHQTMDAQTWAQEFMRLFGTNKGEIDEGLMTGWFANAIMCGYDHRQWEMDRRNNVKGDGDENQTGICQ